MWTAVQSWPGVVFACCGQASATRTYDPCIVIQSSRFPVSDRCAGKVLQTRLGLKLSCKCVRSHRFRPIISLCSVATTWDLVVCPVCDLWPAPTVRSVLGRPDNFEPGDEIVSTKSATWFVANSNLFKSLMNWSNLTFSRTKQASAH